MKQFSLLFSVLLFCSTLAYSQQPFSPSHQLTAFSFSSPGSYRFGMYGYDNPALLSYVHQPDLFFSWNVPSGSSHSLDHWGLFTALPSLGFGMIREKLPTGTVTDYKLSVAMGNRTFSTGLGYGWTNTNNSTLDKSSLLTAGVLYRLWSFVSFGATYSQALKTNGWEVTGDVALRPLRNELLTFFGEYHRFENNIIKDNWWCVGAVVEPLAGIRISGRYASSDFFSIGFHISLGRIGFEHQQLFSHKSSHLSSSYGIRLGASDRSFLSSAVKKRKYVSVDLSGSIDYQRYRLFDETKTLSSLLNTLDAAKADPSVEGIAINTSGMQIDRAKLWEIRDKLADFKSAGKKVIIFIDRGNINLYHFATVADSIVMDPYGSLDVSGYVRDRTYIKGTLDKLGIGFREMRLFKYKSAAESYSRESMSEGEREQWQQILNSWYEEVEKDICSSRNITPEQWRTIRDNNIYLLADDAKNHRLVDAIGRWDTVSSMIKLLTGKENNIISPSKLSLLNAPYDAQWGEPSKIALIYALGTCAMDEGITARNLVKELEAAYNNKDIKAIVLRIDSPGGDALASDYIARVIKQHKGKKPLIVSQGFVAASGGYWLSMYADTIVATPGTLTGSIGVINAWLYNKGLKESLGFSMDKVQIGEHADLNAGVQFPIIGIKLPDRDLNDEEVKIADATILSLYKKFTNHVAEGRKLTPTYVDSVGQGRVWTGKDAKNLKLVDVLGGLSTAIELAKQRAGIQADEKIAIVELPKPGLINLKMFMPRLLDIQTSLTTDPTLELFRFYAKYNGEPMPIVPLSDLSTFNVLNSVTK